MINLFDILKDCVSILKTTTDGKITYANENFCELMGYTVSELLGQNPRILNSGLHDTHFFKTLWQTVQSGKVWHGQICNKKKNGELVWLDTIIGPSFNTDSVLEEFIVVRFDVTEEKKLEMLTHEQALLLSEAAKMAALGEMAGGIAHEINTPLSIILMNVDNLLTNLESGVVEPKSIIKRLEAISLTTERIAKIIKSLRQYSRNSDQDPFERVSVVDVIEDSILLCQEKFRKASVDLQRTYEPDSKIFVSGRRSELSQVMINLLSNASDAVFQYEKKWIEVSIEIKGLRVIIGVKDLSLIHISEPTRPY